MPILDRESMVGVALFDGRVTGEPLSNGELESIFHLLEGLAAGCGRHIPVTMRAGPGGGPPFVWLLG